METFLHVLPNGRAAGNPGTGTVRFRGQIGQLSAELGHVHRITVRPDRQAIGDVLQPGDPEKYHPDLIAAVRELGQRLGRYQLFRLGRQFRRGEFVRHSPERLPNLVLRLLAGVREEELHDRVFTHHRVAGDQREKPQERTPPLLEKLRIR